MKLHPLDPVALIAGLLFALAGVAIIADRQWGDLDATAFTAAGVTLIGLLLVALIVHRYVRQDAASAPAPDSPPPPDPDG